MPKFLSILLVLALFALAVPVAAVTIVECIDADGNSSFRDKCPPGTSKKGEKKLTGLGGRDPASLEAVAEATPLVLYTAPNCDSCDLVRVVLTKRGAPFTEKNVENNLELQQELQKAVGSLTVPTLNVGDKSLVGYNRTEIVSALDEAGYPNADNPVDAASAPAAADVDAASADNAEPTAAGADATDVDS